MSTEAAKPQIISKEWKRHVDGYICGDVGIFPYSMGSWEVWERVAGRWHPRLGIRPFHSLEEAKAALDGSSAKPKNPPRLLGQEQGSSES